MFGLARVSILALVVGAVQIAVGCAGIGESSAADANPTPLTTYPNQVFATTKPGQLGLYIEGQDWHLLVDMPGFEHLEEKFTAASSQFLFMRNATSGTTASIFAERISEANSAESCRKHYASSVQRARDWIASTLRDKGSVGDVAEVEAHGKTLQVFEFSAHAFGPRKAIHWVTYYREFCFHFHFDVWAGHAEEEALKALDSLTYVAYEPRGVDIDRLFYFAWMRIRLSIPMEWQYAYRPPPPGPAGGIELQSTKRESFSFLLVPWGRLRSAAQSDQPEAVAERGRRSLEARGETVSPLRSLCSPDTCVYYFDVTVRQNDKPYSPNVQYHRQGSAKIGEVVLGLSLLYRDDSKDAAEHITAALSRAKVLDLMKDVQASAKDDGKAVK